MTQNEKVLAILVERGEKGLNSFERLNGGIFAAQLPRCVFDLKNLGYEIISVDKEDGSVDYILYGLEPKREFKWDFTGNTAKKVYI